MNIVVLDRSDSWHVRDLQRAAGHSIHVEAISYERLSALIAPPDKTHFAFGDDWDRPVDAVITRAMPAASLEHIVFRMDWLHQFETQTRTTVVNPAKTIETSIDKYLSLERLRDVGLRVPRTHVAQTLDTALEFFVRSGSDAVVKPIFGSRGRGIVRIQDERTARSHFRMLESNGHIIYQQAYVEHGDQDLRLLVIGENVFAMRRCRPGHWITNASQGALCHPHKLTSQEHDVAVQATQAVGASLAGIDVVYDPQGALTVIEVNACPSWKKISGVLKCDVAHILLQYLAMNA